MSLFWMKNNRKRLGPIEIVNFDANHFVLHAQSERCGLGPIDTSNSNPKVAVLHAKTTDEGWDP